MISPRARIGIAYAFLAISLGGCATSDGLAPRDRITLPEAPAELDACMRKSFPDIPDRALTQRDVVNIIGAAKVLDREKSACLRRALSWIGSVRSDFAK